MTKYIVCINNYRFLMPYTHNFKDHIVSIPFRLHSYSETLMLSKSFRNNFLFKSKKTCSNFRIAAGATFQFDEGILDFIGERLSDVCPLKKLHIQSFEKFDEEKVAAFADVIILFFSLEKNGNQVSLGS